MRLLIFYSLFLMVIFTHLVQAQERKMIKGKVLQEDSPISGVLIKNQSTEEYTTSAEDGSFELEVKANDTLWLSHISTKALQKIIRKENLQSKVLTLRLTSEVYELESVEVQATPKIDAVSLGILQGAVEEKSYNEKRLWTASNIKFSLTEIPLDPIINAITGRTKYLKKIVANEKTEIELQQLVQKYTPYLQKELKMKEDEIERFLMIAIEQTNIQNAISVGNDGEVKLYLLELYQYLKEK